VALNLAHRPDMEPLDAFAAAGGVHYLFAAPDGLHDAFVSWLPGAGALPALAATHPAFDWDERELRDEHGVRFDGAPQERAVTAEGEGVSVIVVGPVHAGIIEPGRFTFSSGGETVIHLDGHLGYSRRGVEAALLGGDAIAAAPRVARICGACSASRSWSYARALEELAGCTCAQASEYARVAIAELERIYNHLFDLAQAAAGAGYGYSQTHGLGLKERAHALCAAASGHRLLFDAIVPGGVRAGVLGDPQDVRAGASALRAAARAYVRLLLDNVSVLRRFEGAGVLRPEIARTFGAVGPARRASGGTLDMRTLLGYGAYAVLAPDVALESAGDVAARVRVKAAELDASFAVLDRALAALNGSAPPPPQAVAPRAGEAYAVTEGPRGAETVALACDDAGALARIHVRSASFRTWPSVLRAMEGNIVPDFPLVNKSFNLCYACVDR
jgi:Ni,Fe-hydrogenase III large subunit